MLPLLPLLLCLLASLSLFLPAEDTGPGRDTWQRPQEVMDALGLTAGSVVADVGCGEGYFTFHLAARVTSQGRVYAVDVNEGDLKSIRQRAEREHLPQIQTVLGRSDDPRLPAASLDAALVVNAYHEMRDYDAMLAAIYAALKPGGLLGIIDSPTETGKQRSSYFSRHRVPEEVVREDAVRAGFRFRDKRPGFVRPRGNKEFYFLLFEKPPS
ncbi:MAG TPA: class I SAM-dependent methyltransferase [Candidatus Acidoferrales bacterium]|nr:class I SAM-dependent methyltransferase [Candidatus Acidoferrales bacterium]